MSGITKYMGLFSALSLFLIAFISHTFNSIGQTTPKINLNPVSTDENAENSSYCHLLLGQKPIPVNISEFRIQLLAAMPGSGSDWARLSIKLLTGHYVDSVYRYQNPAMKNISLATKYRPIYYKTHYPCSKNVGVVDSYLHQNAQRVAVIIRDPFDAGFSEYIRQRITAALPVSDQNKLGPLNSNDYRPSRNGSDMKYAGIRGSINAADFFSTNIKDETRQASVAFRHFYHAYLSDYEDFHKHWLQKYSGDLKIVSYNDLVKNASLFIDIAEHFGYEYRSRPTRKRRVECFLMNISKTKLRRRPSIPIIEEAKEKLRQIFESYTQKQVDLTEELCFKKRGK